MSSSSSSKSKKKSKRDRLKSKVSSKASSLRSKSKASTAASAFLSPVAEAEEDYYENDDYRGVDPDGHYGEGSRGGIGARPDPDGNRGEEGRARDWDWRNGGERGEGYHDDHQRQRQRQHRPQQYEQQYDQQYEQQYDQQYDQQYEQQYEQQYDQQHHQQHHQQQYDQQYEQSYDQQYDEQYDEQYEQQYEQQQQQQPGYPQHHSQHVRGREDHGERSYDRSEWSHGSTNSTSSSMTDSTSGAGTPRDRDGRRIVTSRGDEFLQRKQQDYREARRQRELDRRRAREASSSSLSAPSSGGGGDAGSRGHRNNASNSAGPSGGGGYSLAADASIGSSNRSAGANAGAAGDNYASSLMPLPGFEEADLLQRAIERRALLHNRIVAMEAAKAELERDRDRDDGSPRNSQEGSRSGIPRNRSDTPGRRRRSSHLQQGKEHGAERRGEKSRRQSLPSHRSSSMRHLSAPPPQQKRIEAAGRRASTGGRKPPPVQSKPFDEANEDCFDRTDLRYVDNDDGSEEGEDVDDYNVADGSLSASDNSMDNHPNRRLSRVRMGEHHKRMNELSERIKREAQEFMNFESSYANEKRRLLEGGERSDGGLADRVEGGGGRGGEVDDTMVGGERRRESYNNTGEGGLAGRETRAGEEIYDAMVGVEWRRESGDARVDGLEPSFHGTYLDDGVELPDIQEEDEADVHLAHSSESNRLSPSKPARLPETGDTVDWGDGSSSSNNSSSSRGRRSPVQSPVRSPRPDTASEIDPSAWGGNYPVTAPPFAAAPEKEEEGVVEVAGATPQQIARYSNMVRLGIPDVAVLRSMERDGIEDSQEVLRSLKETQEQAAAGGRGAMSMLARGRSGGGGGGALSEAASLANSLPIRDRQDIWEPRGDDSVDSTDSSRSGATSSSGKSSGSRRRRKGGHKERESPKEEGDGGGGRRLTIPLREDPNYSKYFKMLKAKVPRSWVKRVLEVDGKDSRVLDLDPDRPLAEQMPEAVDESGNIDKSDAQLNLPASDSDDSAAVRLSPSSTGADISADTLSSVKAELAAMTAKAAQFKSRLGSAPSDESVADDEDGEAYKPVNGLSLWKTAVQSSMPVAPPASHSGADITSAAVAASNERMKRLRALRTGGSQAAAVSTLMAASRSAETGRRRQTHDEIRQRAPAPKAPMATDGRHTYPEAKKRGSGVSEKSNHEDIPLKDDPRFSKYFQMIRSRVPRSWVERVIEVDDRNPAILDLDPNKSLASQIGEEEAAGKDGSDTVDSTDGSMDDEKSGLSRSTKKSTVTSGEASVDKPPIAQIDDDSKDNDDRSEASSMTREEKSAGTIDLAKISTFLDRMEAQTKDRNSDAAACAPDVIDKVSRRISTTEEVEDRLAAILSAYNSKIPEGPAPTSDVSREEKWLTEKSQADISKLSTLLATKIGSESDTAGTESTASHLVASEQQSDLAALPSLLTQVLKKMKEPEPELEEEVETESKKASANKALEALFAKQAQLLEEDAQPKILCEDPEYAKYFKMLKLGLPRESVIQALERDGKDVTVIDLDPNLPLAEQKNKKPAEPSKHAALENLLSKRAAEIKEKEEAPNKHQALEALFAKKAAKNKTAALEDLVAKKAKVIKEKNEAPDKNAALKALFAKKAGEMSGGKGEATAPPLMVDPEYQKYFKLLKVGMPKETVRQALERDGKDPSIVDMDPEQSYASQATKEETNEDSDPPLKETHAKFFKMLKMGIPNGAVRQALQKEGKDQNIVDMDPEKSYASQVKKAEGDADGKPIKEEYAKFFKMLKMGIPPGAVQNALKKDGKDPEIINMDPEKSYASQAGVGAEKGTGPPLKDDPEFTKFFKMLKMGIPIGAVQNALKKEGKDPEIINMDPEKSVASQQKSKSGNAPGSPKPKVPKRARKRLHWNKIDETKLSVDSFWSKAKDQTDLQLVGLDIDNEEFSSLFTASLNKAAAPKKENPEAKKKKANQKVQLIDGRRRMNGSILLKKFKVNYKVLAKQVDNMDIIEADANEIRGMMQLLPTKDESLALRSYLPPPDAPEKVIQEAIDKLGECEQYMAIMLDVADAKGKFEAMLFRSEFETHAEHIRDGAKLLVLACDSVISSERFRKLLLYALKLGNALNTGGANEEATAITLDSLLKMAEAKAFDRQTSVLHYLVSIVLKNDEDVLKIAEDFIPLKAAERVAVDMLTQQMREMGKAIELVQDVVMRNLSDTVSPTDEMQEDELLESTPMGKFSLSAASKIQSLSSEFDKATDNFSNLLNFFGEDPLMTPEAFFGTINTFVSMFDQTHKELIRKQEAKERKQRIEEKRKLREQEMAAKRLKS